MNWCVDCFAAAKDMTGAPKMKQAISATRLVTLRSFFTNLSFREWQMETEKVEQRIPDETGRTTRNIPTTIALHISMLRITHYAFRPYACRLKKRDRLQPPCGRGHQEEVHLQHEILLILNKSRPIDLYFIRFYTFKARSARFQFRAFARGNVSG